jgi:Flp pilus assembly protein TadG
MPSSIGLPRVTRRGRPSSARLVAPQVGRAGGAERPARRRLSQRGQAMLEFAIILPILMLMIMSVIEFALAFNSSLGINRASQDAALVGAEAGSLPGADCMILTKIEQEINPPIDKNEIQGVNIQRTNPSGTTVFGQNSYVRGGTMTCTLADGTPITVPYTSTGTGYPVNQRCSIQSGCPTMTPARTTVDTIGVQINLRYRLRTPLSALMGMFNGGTSGTMDFTQRNAFRMEPQQ